MDTFFETSPAKAYFQKLERFFIELRGAPLQLSPDDFRTAEEWFDAGIPLALVCEEIRQVVERQRGKEMDVKRRLKYYAPAVEKAFEERRRLHAPGASREAPAIDLAGRLRRLAAAVPAADWSSGVAATISRLDGDAPSIEAQLQELEERVLADAENGFSSGTRARFHAELELATARLRDRLPGGDMVATQQRLKRQILRRFLGLPEMSLFGLEATAEPDDTV